MDWFERLTGFQELGYQEARRKLEVVGDQLRFKVNRRSYGIGQLETPSLGELRARAVQTIGYLGGNVSIANISGDIRTLHADPANANATFQVASQFNLLEMTGPDVTPEHGVTRYQHDPTQGPACAMAAGAATIYRNYFVPIQGGPGQTQHRQIDCLQDIGMALGNEDGSLWQMRNGYALCSESSLARIERQLAAIAPPDRNGCGTNFASDCTGTSK
jgi:hypothetical protein